MTRMTQKRKTFDRNYFYQSIWRTDHEKWLKLLKNPIFRTKLNAQTIRFSAKLAAYYENDKEFDGTMDSALGILREKHNIHFV